VLSIPNFIILKNETHFVAHSQVGRGKLHLPLLSLRSQLHQLVPAPFLQRNCQFRSQDRRKVKVSTCSRAQKGTRLAINLPEAQARCYIFVQKDGLAFTCLADDQYPERVAFMILKKMEQEFLMKYEAKQFNELKSNFGPM
jgi:hypothetical protein